MVDHKCAVKLNAVLDYGVAVSEVLRDLLSLSKKPQRSEEGQEDSFADKVRAENRCGLCRIVLDTMYSRNPLNTYLS